jgi:hypothetical protein
LNRLIIDKLDPRTPIRSKIQSLSLVSHPTTHPDLPSMPCPISKSRNVLISSHDGIFSTLNGFYSTEELYFPEHEVHLSLFISLLHPAIILLPPLSTIWSNFYVLDNPRWGLIFISFWELHGIRSLFIRRTIQPTTSKIGRLPNSSSTVQKVTSSPQSPSPIPPLYINFPNFFPHLPSHCLLSQSACPILRRHLY